MSKTCGECKFYQKRQRFWCLAVDTEHEACAEFESKEEEDE